MILSLAQLDSPESWNEYIYIFTEANQWAYFKGGMSEHGLLDLRDSLTRLMEAPPSKVVATPQHRYYDAHQREIFADMHIQFPGGTVEKVYATQDADGNPDLGINASNDAYMRNHGIPEAEREFYSLSSIDLHGVEICEPTEDLAPKPVYVICQSGLRSYIASRILTGNGFDCYNFAGGFRFYDAVKNDRALIERSLACGMDA